MELQKQKESPVQKIQSTSQNGFTFSYSVTESSNGSQQENDGDSSDEESDSDSEDEIHDYLSATAESAQQNSKNAETVPEFSCRYLDYTLPNSMAAEIKTDIENSSFPTSYEEFVKSLDNTSTFVSYEHFFSALHDSSPKFDNVIQEKSAENEKSAVTCSGDSLISDKESQQKVTTNTDSAIDEVLNFLDDTTKMNSVKFTENYTLTYLNSAIDSDYIELNSTKSPFVTISKSELENNNLTNSAESQQIENQTNDYVSATESIQHPYSEMPQEFSCNYLDFLDSLAENREEEAAKSLKIEESEKSFIDSALLLSSESSVEPHYSKYFFSPEEIEEFSNQFDLHTQIT